jgi:hypothetical protein
VVAPEETEEVAAETVVAAEPATQTTTAAYTQTAAAPEPVYAAPDPEDALVATDEGIRIAQVDDSDSFAEAFADARAQVGPGGAFEWRGHVYNTYYEEEWNNMSTEERANFQTRVDYQLVVGDSATSVTPSAITTTQSEPIIEANAEMVDEQSAQGGIKVLGVETIVDPQGNQMTIAGIEIEDEQALLVDVDNNGVMDVILVDENHDGQVSENEIYDVSDAGIGTADLQQHMAATQTPDMYMANGDGMPDYMNDADVSSMA